MALTCPYSGGRQGKTTMAVANALGANAWNPVQIISPAAFLDPETLLANNNRKVDGC